MTIEAISVQWVFSFLIVFTRIGAGIMLLPGIGEAYVSVRVRLLLAVVMSLVLLPVVVDVLPPMPGAVSGLALLIFGEALVGIMIGMAARMLISTMHVAGMIIAYQSGLGAAMMFDATQGSQSSIIGNFLTVSMVTLLFVSNLHHVLLAGLVESYSLFEPNGHIPIAGFTEFITGVMAESFLIALKISAPQMVVGLILYLGAGVLARLMPNMQIFFVLMPLQISISFMILLVTFSGFMLWYVNRYGEIMGGFLIP